MTNTNLAPTTSPLWLNQTFNKVIMSQDPETKEPMLVIEKGTPLLNHSKNITEANTNWLPNKEQQAQGIPPLKAGDKVILIATMKTDGAESPISNSKYGALFACDGYGSNDRICEISPKIGIDVLNDENYFSKLNIYQQSGAPTRWQGFNNGWRTDKYTWIVPNRVFEKDDHGNPLKVKSPIYGLIAFWGTNWRDVIPTGTIIENNPSNVYIKRIGVYINPTEPLIEEKDPYIPTPPNTYLPLAIVIGGVTVLSALVLKGSIK